MSQENHRFRAHFFQSLRDGVSGLVTVREGSMPFERLGSNEQGAVTLTAVAMKGARC